MKTTLEFPAFISFTNRSPLMVIENNRFVSLENKIKEAIGENLNVIGNWKLERSRYFAQGNPRMTQPPNNSFVVERLTIDSISPHAKKIKVTIEIE